MHIKRKIKWNQDQPVGGIDAIVSAVRKWRAGGRRLTSSHDLWKKPAEVGEIFIYVAGGWRQVIKLRLYDSGLEEEGGRPPRSLYTDRSTRPEVASWSRARDLCLENQMRRETKLSHSFICVRNWYKQIFYFDSRVTTISSFHQNFSMSKCTRSISLKFSAFLVLIHNNNLQRDPVVYSCFWIFTYLSRLM